MQKNVRFSFLCVCLLNNITRHKTSNLSKTFSPSIYEAEVIFKCEISYNAYDLRVLI